MKEEDRQSAVGTGQDTEARLGLWEPQPPGRTPRLGRLLGPDFLPHQLGASSAQRPHSQPQQAEGSGRGKDGHAGAELKQPGWLSKGPFGDTRQSLCSACPPWSSTRGGVPQGKPDGRRQMPGPATGERDTQAPGLLLLRNSHWHWHWEGGCWVLGEI